MKTPPFKETCAWPTDEVDEVEKRHPGEDQSDEDDGDHEDNEFIGHVNFSWTTIWISAGIRPLLDTVSLAALDLAALDFSAPDGPQDSSNELFQSCGN